MADWSASDLGDVVANALNIAVNPAAWGAQFGKAVTSVQPPTRPTPQTQAIPQGSGRRVGTTVPTQGPQAPPEPPASVRSFAGQGARGTVGGVEASLLSGHGVAQAAFDPGSWMLPQAFNAIDRTAATIQRATGWGEASQVSQPAHARQSPSNLNDQVAGATKPAAHASSILPQIGGSQNYGLADLVDFETTLLRASGLPVQHVHPFGETTGELQGRQPWLKDPPRNFAERGARTFGSLLPASPSARRGCWDFAAGSLSRAECRAAGGWNVRR